MSSNQTIDGVAGRRELLESIAAYVADSPNAIMRARAMQLRALLDAPIAEVDPIVGVLKRCLSEGVQPTFSGGDLKHLIRLLESKPVAQPQGDPVAWVDGLNSLDWYERSLKPLPVGTKLYAEQPAPVPGELVAEIVEFGFGLKEISWKGGKMPEVGVRLYSAPPAAPVPGGWKLVPINPTPDMLKAVDDEASDKHLARGRAISAWGLMLDAAPLPSIRDLHYGVAHAVECQLPAQRLVGGHEIGGLHFPAPSQLAAAVASAGDGRALEPAEPILVEAVAVTRMCPQDGLWLDWLIEGGIAALELPGTVLLVAQGVLTNDSGNGYVYPARNSEDDE